MEIVIDKKENIFRYWWLMLLKGVFFILAGLFFVVYPGVSYLFASIAINIFLGVTLIVVGVLSVVFSFSVRRLSDMWVRGFVFGVLAGILGVILLIHPGASAAALPFLMGVWLLFESVSLFGAGFDMKNMRAKGWIIPMIGGLFVLIFSVMVIFDYTLGMFAFVYWVAFSLMCKGIADVFLSFDLKKAKKIVTQTIYDADYREI